MVRCVVRTGDGERELRDSIRVEPGRGVAGDTWEPLTDAPAYGPCANEVSLVNERLLAALTGGDPERMALSGDNLQVDLDLSEANLPPGSELAIGEVRLVVSALPHRPCGSFAERFGKTAAKRVARANRRGLRGRGVLCTVVRGGEIAAGTTLRVVSRASSS